MDNIKGLVSGKNLILLVSFIIAGCVVYRIKDIALLFFASFVIASAINPIVDKISNKMPRKLAVLTVYLSGFIIVALFFIPLFDVFIKQALMFLNQVPTYWQEAEQLIRNWKIIDRIISKLPDFSQMITTATGLGQDILNRSINITINFVAGLAVSFTLAMITLYMVLDKNELKFGYLKFFPKSIRQKADQISVSISRKVGGYVIGQLLIMLAVGALISIGLFIAGVNFAILLGFIAGVFDIIPVVGPLLSVTIAIIVAVSQKPILAVWVILVYMLVQWVVDTFLRPIIMGKFLDLHPLVLIFALLVAATNLGIIGVVLAPALAATVYVLIEELYLKRINFEADCQEFKA